MDKQVILDEIRRMAEADGIAPGKQRFEKETGIRESKWSGVYWAKWSEAVIEAGCNPRVFQAAHPDEQILAKLAGLVRKKGRFPTGAEIRLEKRIDPEFPWHNVVARLGNKAKLVKLVGDFCKNRSAYADIVPFLAQPSAAIRHIPEKSKADDEVLIGSVYLIKGGKHYKIGFTNDLGRRKYDLRIQLPERVHLIHEISTDDPKGIEQYWHRRFADRRANGEWFSLTPEDVAAFKRRKSM